MNYRKIYDQIILHAKNLSEERKKDRKLGIYFERHHIIPRSLGGNNAKENIVLLTAREHFLCHWLLVNCARKNGTLNEYHKMAAAFTQMCRGSNRGDRSHNSKSFHWARKIWSSFLKENHWSKSEDWRNKHSDLMKKYYRENPIIKKNHILEERICVCGCYGKFITKLNRSQKFIHGHNSHDTLTNKKRSKSMKTTLSKMSKEELSVRSKHSFGSCDHKIRGDKISDIDFINFLDENNYSLTIRTRFTTYRNEYINSN